MGGLAADMGAGELQVFADEMHQQRARFDEAFDLGAVDLHGHMGFCHFDSPPQLARPAARVSARVTMMPPTCLRYSTGPRASAAGDMIASAAAAAFFSVAASRLVPITALAASAASSGVSDRLVSPIVQLSDLAARHGQHHRGRGGGVVADLALQLFVGVAVTGGGHGNRTRGQEFAGLERGEIGALVELGGRDVAGAAGAFEPVARAERHHQRRHVVAGIAIGDIAADGAAVAHLRIGDQKRGFVQDRQRFADFVGRQQFVLGGHRADHDRVAVAADALEPGDAMQIDQMFGAWRAAASSSEPGCGRRQAGGPRRPGSTSNLTASATVAGR